jgi:hypothetical protein
MNVKQQWWLWLVWLEKHLVEIYKLEVVARALMIAGAIYHWAVQHRLGVTGQLITKRMEKIATQVATNLCAQVQQFLAVEC